MLTEKIVKIPIYRYTLKIVVSDTYKEISDKYPEVGSDTSKGVSVDYGDKGMICVPPKDLVTAVHECEHIKNMIWKRIGYTPIIDNDEPDAYLIECIFDEVIKVIEKHLASKC